MKRSELLELLDDCTTQQLKDKIEYAYRAMSFIYFNCDNWDKGPHDAAFSLYKMSKAAVTDLESRV